MSDLRRGVRVQVTTDKQSNGSNQERETKPHTVVPNAEDIEISRAGYKMWHAAGRPAGRYMEYLAIAEEQFKQEAASKAGNRKAAAR